MRAGDVMTTKVVSIAADTPLRDVARLLLEHGISAVPVLDADGSPVGMVSEGDLVSRDEVARLQRRDWWLQLVADDAAPGDEFLSKLRATGRTAGDVMSAPVVTVGEGTELAEVARLLSQHHIKRVPVVTDGHVVGIVSRADLLRALAIAQPDAAERHRAPADRGFLLNLFGEYHRPSWEVVPPAEDTAAAAPAPSSPAPASPAPASPAPSSPAPSSGVSASAFRSLIEDFHSGEAQQREATRRASAEHSAQLAKELIDTHVTDEAWQALLRHARQAAEKGEKECLLLRFPNAVCTDGGRAIDVAQETWPATLRGEAAEVYLRWERELKGQGFHLAARVLEYPGGMPGDIGLFLVWGVAE